MTMERLLPALLAIVFAFITPYAYAVDTPEAIAIRLLDTLDAKDYAAAEASFTPEMAAAAPADKLEAVWESLPAQLGIAKGRGEAKVTPHQGMQVVVIPLHYANGGLIAQVVVDATGKIAGFLIQPAPPAPAMAPAADASYIERDFLVVDLPGTLAVPKAAPGAQGIAAVVLVHGSGPQDRDETIGPNRPFLDIARGLAAQGIAVLRYEKRTKARPQDFADGKYTMDEETTDDAVAAVAALRTTPGIDPGRVFVFGHSQGGMLAPSIARQSGHVAGLILFAAPARSLLTVLPEQNRYLFNADGGIDAQEQQFLDDLDRKIANVRDGTEIADKDTPLGLPAGYWRAFEKIDPLADARSLKLPLLLLQGGRDFQVVDTDWRLWKKKLSTDPRAAFKRYPALNHLGIAGQGEGSLAEYNTPGHVDPLLIDD
ncbi:MAG TPA: alpha/beta fold hydrolase, partial [Pseudoxanthomonas sp.]